MSMHMFTGSKGDPLCPLGFHPQVRWPTRCKRCFRDYKEHGGRSSTSGREASDTPLRKDDVTMSTPSLSTWHSRKEETPSRISSSVETSNQESNSYRSHSGSSSSSSNNRLLNTSWTSTPDLTETETPTISLTLPRRRTTVDLTTSIDASNRSTEFTVRRRTMTSTDLSSETPKTVKEAKPKIKVSSSTNTTEHLVTKKSVKVEENAKPPGKLKNVTSNPDVEFILKVKSSKDDSKKNKKTGAGGIIPGTDESSEDDDNISLACTETTDTTLVNDSDLQDQIDSLKNELEAVKTKCERVEREKSDILLRRLATYETTSSKTSEVLKLQQKVNELSTQAEDLKDDKKSLSLRVKELERELDLHKNSNKKTEELQAKLTAAETLCEELMDENEDMKKELRELEEEIEEMQDNFREDQADEYSSLRKELEQTTKNCRILSFKLRKAERRAEQLEVDKVETEQKYKDFVGGPQGVDYVEKIRKLEADLAVSNEVATRLTKELEETNLKLKNKEDAGEKKKKAPLLGNLPKIASGEKVSRASLTRGGSQEDSQQLLRDLQDSMEREADLREQLRFAEEEASSLRKKATRMEEDNDSLALQLKKMATKARTRKHSPNRLTPEPFVEKDEGISEEEDPTELRLLLELNEQETAVLRRKVDELESDMESKKLKIKELEEKVTTGKVHKKPIQTSENISLLDKEKIKVIEDECNELRKKLIEKERENERLQTEIQLNQKKTKGSLIKSKSLDSTEALDLRRQLQLVEQEASILRAKTQTLESENEKLTSENKKLQMLRGTKKRADTPEKDFDKKPTLGKSSLEMDKVKKELKEKADELESIKKEKNSIEETLKRLREESALNIIKFYKARNPKKPSDIHTKLQLKKMVEDLENEVGDILIALEKSSNNEKFKTLEISKAELEKSFKDKENEKNSLLKQLEEEKSKIKKVELEKKKLDSDLQKLKTDQGAWKVEEKKLKENIEKLLFEKKNSVLAQDEVAVFVKKLENLNKELEKEKENVKKGQEELAIFKKLEEEKVQLQKEITERNKQLLEADKKLKESDDKVKKLEKSAATSKSKISKLEKSFEEAEKSLLEQQERWKKIEEDLNGQEVLNASLKGRIAELEMDIDKKAETIKNLEESVRMERARATDLSAKAGSAEKREITSLRADLTKKMQELDEINAKFDALEKSFKSTDENQKKIVDELKKEKEILERKTSDLEIDLNAERKKMEKMKEKHDKELKNRETELSALKVKIRSLEQSTGTSNKKVAEVRDELTAKIQKLESELSAEKQEYEDLTVKYELLEEEHVVTKAQLVMEKEHLASQAANVRREADAMSQELTTLKETFSKKQDQWIKEKLDLQEEVKESIEKSSRACENKFQLEKTHLVAMHGEQISIAENFKQRNEAMAEQMEHMRKENDELRKKLDDFDKVSKIHRQMTAESNQIDAELREAKAKLVAEEKNHKGELAALKLRYEGRVNLITEELQSSQAQISRFKRERDNFRHMLEEAQSQMADLKSGKKKENRLSSSSNDESEDAKGTIAALEQQVSCMEDELSEARLECSRLKTELVSEKSSWEVKLSELQSRVNELEEEKILSSGRTKIPGLRTRMELAWQKEREEQHRLLQETSTLARDLRQTLFEVERERDKERLEAKRRQDQFKKATDEEMEENRKKITELQCDLLELRDAHAKLRTTNEKLRREKDRENARAQQRLRSRNETSDDSRQLIDALIDQIGVLVKSTKRSKSRESTPAYESSENVHAIVQKLQQTVDLIHQSRAVVDVDLGDRSRRSASIGFSSRRAGSSEPSDPGDPNVLKRLRAPTNGNNLHRKSLSLSETAGAQEQTIWRESSQEHQGSVNSLDEHVDNRLKNLGRRETSMDSRLSGGSTQSEMAAGEKKKKKGFLGKLKKLARSQSDDDGSLENFSTIHSGLGSDSDMMSDTDVKGSKKDLKGRISGMFKKSSSRANSSERESPEPLRAKTLPRQSPAKSTLSEKSATMSRNLDRTKNPAASLVKPKPK